MRTDRDEVVELEKKFWQALVEEDADTATAMLTEPAFLVTSHGTVKLDHTLYKRMASQGSMVVTSYELGDIETTFAGPDTAILSYEVRQVLAPRGRPDRIEQRMVDTSTWVRRNGTWKCVMHTESPAPAARPIEPEEMGPETI